MNKRRNYFYTAVGVALIASIALIPSGVHGAGSAVNWIIFPRAANSAQGGNPQEISPSAWQQIQELAAEKAARTPEQQKIDSQLLYAAKMNRGEKLSASVPALQVDTEAESDNKTVVDIAVQIGRLTLENLEANGAEIMNVVPRYNHVRARVSLDQLEKIASLPEVQFIRPKDVMILNTRRERSSAQSRGSRLLSPGLADRAARIRTYSSGTIPKFPSRSPVRMVDTPVAQGDVTHKAAAARNTFGMNGTGIKIGVLSDGVTNLRLSQDLGALGPVTVLPGQRGSGDEGTAMLEIIHALAPGAQLFFATANNGPANFANNIRMLRAAGADIIVDDIIYFSESPFQDGQASNVFSEHNGGVIAQAVNDVTADGALYFSAAGNEGNITDQTASVWEGDFKNGANGVHDFGGGKLFNTVNVSSGPIILTWSDPLGASANDYDLYVLNSDGTKVIAASNGSQKGTQDPIEIVAPQPQGALLVVVKSAGANRFLRLQCYIDGTNGEQVMSFVTTGATWGHSSTAAAFSVAATPAGAPFPSGSSNDPVGPFPGAFNPLNRVELASGDGPRHLFFKADGTPFTPGNFSSTGGILRQKPDITAADGVSVTGVGGFLDLQDTAFFYGASAAAPHAAAIAALLKSANPGFSNDQIRMALINTAIDIQAPGVDRNSGAGIVMALESAQFLGVTPMADIDIGTVNATELGGNGNGFIETGEGGRLSIQLKNSGVLNATNITATLTSSTPGVIVGNGASNYPDLIASTGMATNILPFDFSLSTAVPCSATSIFTLTVNYTGGPSAKVFTIEVPTGLPPIEITSTLDATAPTAGPTFMTATGLQNGRLNRATIPSNCGENKTFPGIFATTGVRRFDMYTFPTCFTNAPSCITVSFTTPCGSVSKDLFAAAYLDAFDPNNPSANYLGDIGFSPTSNETVYASFAVRGGRSLVIVVHEVNPGAGIGCNYALNVSGLCQSCVTANLVCLQDDRTGDNLLFNSITGDYVYTRCGDDLVLSGRGRIDTIGCNLLLKDSKVSASVNHCPLTAGFFERGNALIKIGLSTSTIKDTNKMSTCSCP